MRLLISFVFVSTLVLHLLGAAAAATAGIGEACSDIDKCADQNAECTADKKCACKANYVNNGGTCKLVDGQPCTDQKKTDCSSGVCKNNKCAPASGASAVAASLILMVLTLVTSRFL